MHRSAGDVSASSLARKTTEAAISAAVPSRPAGTLVKSAIFWHLLKHQSLVL